MTFPSAPVSSLKMSWFVHWGDWNFSCTSACVPSVFPAVPSVFISSWSKYSSLWLSGSFEFSTVCMPCFFDITGRVGRHALVYLAPAMHIFIQWFALPHPRPHALSTTVTIVSTVTLLWLSTVSLILRRPPIMNCAVVGCIMPRFACCRWPTNTHCMNGRFGSEALQLLFCSFFRSGYTNNSSDRVSSLWISFDCTCSELVPNMRVSSMTVFIGICLFTLSCHNAYCFHIRINTFHIVLLHRSQFESSNSEVAFWGHIFSEPVTIHR